MNRGSCAGASSTSSASQGFNEAPIHESGKYTTTAAPKAAILTRFNEAPIHESGKSLGRGDAMTERNRLQ